MATSHRSGVILRCCLVVFAVASALYVSGPALYWKFKKGFIFPGTSHCRPCVCDCPPPLSLANIAPGLINLSVEDCRKHDPELSKEMEKQFVDLLWEELRLQETTAGEHAHHMELALSEATRIASLYQKEAEKCNVATEICEEGRERAEASLSKEKKITALWERHARQLGWEGD